MASELPVGRGVGFAYGTGLLLTRPPPGGAGGGGLEDPPLTSTMSSAPGRLCHGTGEEPRVSGN